MTDHQFSNLLKRMAHILVLEILKNHTDIDHGLKVTQVVALLEEDYGVKMERKAISRILNDLFDLTEIPEEYSWKHPLPYSIKYDITPRSTGEIRENWRICKNFDDVEIRILTDLVQTIKGYPTASLTEKLQQLGSMSMQDDRLCSQQSFNGTMPGNSMRYSMDAIMRAIKAEKKLTFHTQDNNQQYIVSPYKMALRNGVYYLVCYDESKDDMAIFPIENISNASVQDAPSKDYHMIPGACQWQYDTDRCLDSRLTK